jgi:hypothetical protein
MSASSSASGLFGSTMSSYGVATYDQTVYGSKPSGVRGKQNAPSSGLDDSWWNWLDEWVKNGNGKKYGKGEDTNHDGYGDERYLLDKQQIQEAYDEFVGSYWNPGMGVPPTFEEWWEWYSSTMYGGAYGAYGDGNYYQFGNYLFTPVGDILPLVLMVILYMIILFVKRNKTAQL